MKSGKRREKDTLGTVEVPEERLWGAQTERSLSNFPIGEEQLPAELIRALVLVKLAAARANAALGLLETEKEEAIVQAAEEVLDGAHPEEFPLSVWQTGSGTQTHMNVNEVLANRASEILGGSRGNRRLVHPNDDLNRGQSTNDVFPTAMHLAAVEALRGRLLPALERLRDALEERRIAFDRIIKIGRTHLMDATPLTLGQEFSAYVSLVENGRRRIENSLPRLYELAIGGSTVGSGLNAAPGFAAKVLEELEAQTGYPFESAPNKFEALSSHEALLHAHGVLKALAASLTKIANDIRWLASGPRAGLGELSLPANEPGSSSMPGKVNPTQAEALLMVAARVLGNDVTINLAGAGGNFELNVMRPVLIHVFLQSVRLLADSTDSFASRCVAGIEANETRIREHLERSLMLVTALSPHIGYDAAAKIAKHAHEQGSTLREAALALGLVTAEQFDKWVRPQEMVGPRDPES